MLLGLVFFENTQAQFYNGTKTDFGQNRVQFDDFEWKYYRFQKYETYFYKGGNELAIFTAKTAEKYIEEQELLFDYYLKDRIQFVIYNKLSHFKQSNVGVSDENTALAGISNILGSKVFIYFDGNHKNFEAQIKEGIAGVLVNQQVYGANWRQALKNSSLLTLPDWYQQGLTSWASNNWSPEIEDQVRDGIISGKYKKFNRLSGEEAIIAGHSMWHYIAKTYGESVIPNILYMTRESQSIEKGFLFVLGVSMKSLTKEWHAYYENIYTPLEKNKFTEYKSDINIKARKNRTYQQFKVSPDGNSYVFTTNQLGQYKIYIQSDIKKRPKKIFKREYRLDRLNDYSYPITAWHPSGKMLAFVIERRGLLILNFYDLETKKLETKNVFNMEKILDMDYSDDGKHIIFSGIYKGQSDLYLYHIGSNSQKNLTNDVFDDLQPKFIENSKKIVFISNRPNDTLNYEPADSDLFINQKDVWILNHTADEHTLTRVTNTPTISESQPFDMDSMITFLSPSSNLLVNRFNAKRDSFITHIDTAIHYHHYFDAKLASNYNRSILEQDVNLKSGKFTEVVKNNYRYQLLSHNLNAIDHDNLSDFTSSEASDTNNTSTQFTDTKQYKNGVPLKVVELDKDTTEEVLININNYVFDKEDKVQKNVIVIGNETVVENQDSIRKEFKLPNQRNYNLSFFNDNSAVQLNNSFINGQYQIFTGGPFTGPGLGGVIKFGITDLFEDYKVYGGIRLSGGTNEYFMSFQNLIKRLDKEYTFSRTESKGASGFAVFDIKTNALHYSLSWPFSEVASIRFTLSGRNDRIVTKSTDLVALQIDDFNEYRGVGKVAYIFDNTRKKALNIYYGTRFKIFGEHFQEFFDESGEQGNMQVLGLDFRRYQKISRELIWVNRIAGSASFGSEKLIYYLGSVDDWMVLGGQQRFINQDEIDFSIPYRYQALAANLRGFPQNIRRGTNFALLNSEVRWPVFKYLIRRPIRSNLIRNFQVIGFGDIGTAWNGLNPYDQDNAINKKVIVDGPMTVTVFTNTEPLVAGYGFGLRTSLLGYFIRADWAWGVEDGLTKDKPLFYLSLSLDI